MADDSEQKPGGNKKKLILIIAFALILIGIGVGGAVIFMGDKSTDEQTVEVTEEKVKKAYYFSLDPPFVVNFHAEGRGRFLQITLDAMTYDESVLDVVRTHMPAIRNDLILLFSEQDSGTLMTPEGKNVLRATTLATIQKVIEKESGNKGVDEVYFTSFVMQ